MLHMDNKTASDVSTKLVLLDAALKGHDDNATALTEARKTLRKLLSDNTVPKWLEFEITSTIDALNLCIITSRKLAKGELP